MGDFSLEIYNINPIIYVLFLTACAGGQKYRKPTSHDSQLWFEQYHQALRLLEEGRLPNVEDQKIVDEYDDCDVTVDFNHDINIEEEMRKIGFKSIIKKSSSSPIASSSVDEDDLQTDNSDKQTGEGSETPQSPSSVISTNGQTSSNTNCKIF